MPTLYATANWKITMYFRDHSPPHFHLVTRNRREAQIRIADFTVMAGEVPSAAMEGALKWAASNRPLLATTWEQLHPKDGR